MSRATAFQLSQSDKIALVGLTTHPGYAVLSRMMQTALQHLYTDSVDADNEQVASAMRYEARGAKNFCELIRKAITMNVQVGNVTASGPIAEETNAH